MTRLINKIFSGFYKLPLIIQWLLATVFLLIDAILLAFFFISPMFPLNLLLLPFFKTLIHLMATPFLRLIGYLKYYSPMLILIHSKSRLELHNGAIFDYMGNMRWKHRGIAATKIIMVYYLTGLLTIIKAIENKEISDNIFVTGVSYFFSENTARRIGFSVKKPGIFKKFLFVVDYFNLFLMFSYSKGKISFPNINRLKKVEIAAAKLVEAKPVILKILSLLECNNLIMAKM